MTDTVAVAWIGSFTAILVAAIGLIVARINQVHNLVNSRMTELLDLTRSSAKAEGRVDEQHEQSARENGK